MKKIFISLFLTFALLILSNVESNGQACCPSGYDHTIDTISINGTCELYVEYCYKCDPHTLYRSVYICNIIIPWNQPGGCNLDGTDIGSQGFWEAIYVETLEKLTNKPSCGNYEPCGEVPCTTSYMPNRFVEIKKAACFRKFENPFTQQTSIIPCETEAQCVIEYCVCYDGPNLTYNIISSYEVGSSGCPKRKIGIGGPFVGPDEPDHSPFACFNPCY
jgi:hypothetical protein